jgi:exosome complex RNA-binding protein Rrp42 (RNase PH superfamily)
MFRLKRETPATLCSHHIKAQCVVFHLCQVWALRVDCHVLDDGGNLVDACCLSALAALMAFRKPEVTVGGKGGSTDITVHSAEEREPLPLTIHHLPIPVTFGFFEVGVLITE